MEFRLLQVDDYNRGFLQLLEQLTVVDADNISFEEFKNHYDKIQSIIYVIHDTKMDLIVGTGSLFIEYKYIHKLGSVGHIEDIIIDVNYRNKGFGKKIINILIDLAKKKSCYKVILDCDINNATYYEHIGFLNKGNYMALYY
jgi:glucosamine-phosphate N-acetyltransferase